MEEANPRAQVDTNQRLANAGPSWQPSTSAAATSDVSSGERLCVGMTKEGPLGEDYRTTMQRDHHERWTPTEGDGTIPIEEAREARRNFYVGETKEHETFSIASAEASPLRGELDLGRRNADEAS